MTKNDEKEEMFITDDDRKLLIQLLQFWIVGIELEKFTINDNREEALKIAAHAREILKKFENMPVHLEN